MSWWSRGSGLNTGTAPSPCLRQTRRSIGFVHCLDSDTGKLHWVYDMKAHMWGSTFVVDGKVYVGDEDGDVCVFASDRKLKLLSEVNVGAPVYSTAIVANGTLYLGSQTHLFAIAEGAKPVEAKPAVPDGPKVIQGLKPRPVNDRP
ncbi:MAG: hypothetical protein EB140_09265 [Proteobacteria bacterium]|nr:hypothetical protein [Pseudomonadota bacterium]